MDYIITLYLLHYIYRKLNESFKYIYIATLAGLYVYYSPDYMDMVKSILLIDIIFNTFYALVYDNIYLQIKNELIVLAILYYFSTIMPEQYYVGNLLKRYTVHRYGLID